jgi:hypothetical protein
VHRSIRLLGTLLAFALAALLLAGPAAAWRVHDVAHLGAPVASDQHHHHQGGHVTIGDADHGSNDDGDADREGGHDHMPSLTAGLSALPAEAPVVAQPEPSVSSLSALPSKAPPERTTPPQIRPPRLG